MEPSAPPALLIAQNGDGLDLELVDGNVIDPGLEMEPHHLFRLVQGLVDGSVEGD